jgi:hypothetical protein
MYIYEASVVSEVSVNEASVISEVSVNEASGSLTTVVSGDANGLLMGNRHSSSYKGQLFAMTFIKRDEKWIRKHFRSGRRNCLLVPDS